MKWSWKIAQAAGIEVRVHVTLLILLAWIALAYWHLEGTLGAAAADALDWRQLSVNLALPFVAVLAVADYLWTGNRFAAGAFAERQSEQAATPSGDSSDPATPPDTPPTK